MKNCHSLENPTTRRVWLAAWATALAVALTVPQTARADTVTPPPVPSDIQVPAGNVAFLVGHAVGTQNYICLPSATSATGFDWSLFTPEATLFSDDDKQITTHFFGPNPAENRLIRAAWQHSRDTSTVWAKLFRDPVIVTANAIPWLVLQMAGVQAGPTGGDRLTKTTFIHRVNTQGGVAPSTGCSSLENVGAKAFVPYTADYFFYKDPDADRDARRRFPPLRGWSRRWRTIRDGSSS
jgi:hypothetical protein